MPWWSSSLWGMSGGEMIATRQRMVTAQIRCGLWANDRMQTNVSGNSFLTFRIELNSDAATHMRMQTYMGRGYSRETSPLVSRGS